MIKDQKLKRKFMQGYCWILLCKEPEYSYTRETWKRIAERTQELRDKLHEQGATQEEMMDLINRCRDFMNSDFSEMDIDQKAFFAELIFV